jgi:anti-sigma B factor antagonist
VDVLNGPEARLLRLARASVVDGVVVHVAGEVDLVTAPQLDDELTDVEVRPVPPARLVLDLTEVTFLASVGLAALIDHDERCREAGIELRVVAGNRTVSRSISSIGLAATLDVYDSLDDAVGP